MSTLYQWSSTQKLQHLKTCLTGKAIGFVRTLTPHACNKYRRMVERLRQRFRGIDRPEILRKNLHDVKQRADESLDDFADRIQTVVATAFQRMDPEISQVMGTEHFLRGVRDRTAAYESARAHPQTVPQALLAMKDANALLKSVMGRSYMSTRQVTFQEEPVTVLHSQRPRSPSPTPNPKPRVTGGVRSVTVGTQSSPPRTPPRRTKNQASSPRTPPYSPRWSPRRGVRPAHDRCFNCNQPGHFRAECPVLKNSPKAQGQQ
jgi:hypothetical protein